MLPAAALVGRATQSAHQISTAALTSGLFREALANSVLIATVSAVAATVLGAALALLLERTTLPGRKILKWLLLAPLFVPTYVGALGWLALLDAASIPVVLALHSYPISYLITAAALSRIPNSLLQAAAIGGAGHGRIIFGVLLPLLRPALLVSVAVTFLFNVADAGTPAVLGQRNAVLTLPALFPQLPLPAAALVSTVVLVLVVFVVAGIRALLRTTSVKADPTAKLDPLELGSVGHLAGGVLWVGALVLTLAPTTALIGQAFGASAAPTAPGMDQGVGVIWPTIQLGLAVAVVTLLVGIGAGMLLARNNHRTNKPLGLATAVPFLVPGFAIATAFVSCATFLPEPLRPTTPGNTVLLAASYSVAFMPLVVWQVRAALGPTTQLFEEAALISGANRVAVFTQSLTRIALPVAVLVGVLVALLVLRDANIALAIGGGTDALRTDGSWTGLISERIIELAGSGYHQPAAQLALGLTSMSGVVAAVVVGLLTHLNRRNIQS